MMGNFSRFMYNGGVMDWGGAGFGFAGGLIFGLAMLALVVWTLYWKYQALWYAAKHDHKWWFIALLVINTAGILEILYLYVFSKKMVTPGHDEKSVPMLPQ
ncbi:MAG: DUF5652 family protein [Candidatus Taylorbacteria bacterium]|nr:DUF5652 family protein [Candidatus Taylorbacteria bacterium]